MKINRIRASMIATLALFIENIYNHHIVLLRNDNQPFATRRSSSPNQFLPCSPGLVRHTLLFVFFIKDLISSLTNVTPAFSTL